MENQIEITDGMSKSIIVNKGNFSFVYQYDKELFTECHEGERNIYIDPSVAIQKFRNSIEKFAIHAETNRRIRKDKELQFVDTYQKVKSDIDAYSQNSSDKAIDKATAKGYFISTLRYLSKTKSQAFDKIYTFADEQWSIKAEWEAENQSGEYEFSAPRALARKLYAVTSNSSHNSVGEYESAVSIAKILFGIYVSYFSVNAQFDERMIPMKDYYPVRKKYYESFFGLSDKDINLYVSETNRGIHYHILKKLTSDDNSCRRSLDISNLLWEEMKTDNVLVNYSELGQNGNKILVLNLPEKPMSLDKVLSKMTRDEKRDAAFSIISTVKMLHTSDPIIVHRTLSPMDFLVFQKNGKTGVFLYNFNTAKQKDKESEYTVIGEVSKEGIRSRYIAQEIMENSYESQWLDRADIYSLGEILIDILDNDDKQLINNLIEQMCHTDYSKRPDINYVYDGIRDALKTGYCYSIGTNKNPGRKQQDAFFVSGCESIQSDELSYAGRCQKHIFCAVFDGLGGGHAGNEISQLCAELSREFWQESIKSNYRMVLEKYVRKLQDSVLAYMDEECYDYAGTTIAATVIEGNKLFIANVGDSRIHLINKDGIETLSKDHRFTKGIVKQKELYQYIGIDESDGKVIPYIDEFDISDGDYILISSDGLTDFVDTDVMRKIVMDNTESDAIDKLIIFARENGSKDDITAILVRGENYGK